MALAFVNEIFLVMTLNLRLIQWHFVIGSDRDLRNEKECNF